jgi:hypothetical protein
MCALLTTMTAMVSSVSVVRGQPGSPKDKAKAQELYKQSKAASDNGDFVRGEQLMMKAYDILPDPAFLSLAADALQSANKPAAALQRFCEYLNKASKGPLAPHATKEAQRLHSQLGREVASGDVCDAAELQRTLHPPSPKATPKPAPTPTPNEPIVTQPDLPPSVVLDKGVESQDDDSGATLQTAGLIAGGVGVISLGIGTYYAFESSRLERLQDPDLNDKGAAANLKATIGLSIGAAFVVTGGILYYIGHNRSNAPRQLSVVPFVSTSIQGVVVGGYF